MPTPISKRPLHRLLGLCTLFPPGHIFMDTDRDGIPDRLGLFVGVEPGLDDPDVWAAILNLAARLAAEVVSWRTPLVGPLAAAPSAGSCLFVHAPSRHHAAPAEVLRMAADRFALRGRSPGALAALLHTLAVSIAPPSTKLKGWALLRNDPDRADRVQAIDKKGGILGELVLVPPVASRPAAQPAPAGCDLLDLDHTFYHSPAGAPMRKRLLLSVDLPRGPVPAPLGAALAEVVARLALAATEIALPLAVVGRPPAGGVTLHVAPGRSPVPRIVPAAEPGARGIHLNLEGPPAALSGLLRRWIGIGFPDGPGGDRAAGLRSAVAAARESVTPTEGARPLAVRGSAAAALDFRHRWRSETRRVADSLRGLPAGEGRLEGLILVSKPNAVRRALAVEVGAILRAKGYRPRICVLNAYKPGLSWLLEVVLPRLKQIPNPVRLEVAYRPFAPGEGALEMESRWLQEIFPGPDLLAAAVGIGVDAVRLVNNDTLPDAYRVRAWDRRRRRVFQSTFTPRVTSFDYLPGRPEEGRVHPAAGGIRLSADGRLVLDVDIPTDREIFWRHFQAHWLPALEASMRARMGAARENALAAFWEEVRFDVAIDESDRRLGVSEERVAPMEALHEDLYFGLLDFFRVFGREHGLPETVSFGRIFPRVSAKASRRGPAARMRARALTAPAAAGGPGGGRRAQVTALAWEKGRLLLAVAAPGQAASAGSTEAVSGAATPSATAAGSLWLRRPMPRPVPEHPADRKNIPSPPMGRRLTAAAVNDWIRRLGRLPQVHAWQAGVSWQGRPIQAVEVALPAGGTFSVARLRLVKPTLLLNARHHANEISSTNAALRLVWELAATGWGRRALQRVNVAIVPLENADGVATLEALLPGAEDHKLHAARYNALGVEWYADYFAEAPRFPEARVKPRLWRRWLPRIVLDAHGVPSHEWEQPFAGYAPGRFRPYWIPRAFIYAVVPFLDEPDHPGHALARRLVRVMAAALDTHAVIRARHREISSRYRRYARGPAPDIFPPGAAESLLALPAEKRIAGLNFAVRRFPVTMSEIITEVPDEVVSGRLLALCARGHLTVAKALIDFLGRTPPGRLVRRPSPRGGLVVAWEQSPAHGAISIAGAGDLG